MRILLGTDTRTSTTRYAFRINYSLVTWSSQHKKLVTLSTTESEYVAVATACKEAIWLKQLLKDLGYRLQQPTVLFVDNQSTIRLICNPKLDKRTKYHLEKKLIMNKWMWDTFLRINNCLIYSLKRWTKICLRICVVNSIFLIFTL